jgi:hypothetical protein
VHESACGTNRTSSDVRSMVANGGKQTSGEPFMTVAIDPHPTSAVALAE